MGYILYYHPANLPVVINMKVTFNAPLRWSRYLIFLIAYIVPSEMIKTKT